MSTVTKCDACGTTSEDCFGWIELRITDHGPRTLADKPVDSTRNYCPRCRKIFLKIMTETLLSTIKEVTERVDE